MNTTIENPLVSVVMPAYNAAAYLEEAVKSILEQSYGNFEFIIIDDGSADRTREILEHFTDPRIKLIFNEKNEGNYPARNKGCRLAGGKYIAVMDADDIADPDRLAVQVRFMEENPEVGVVGSAYKLSDRNTTIVEPVKWEEIRYVLMKTFCMLHPTLLIRKRDMEAIGFYKTESLYAEDYDLVLRLALKCKVVNLPDVLLTRRLHDEQISKVHKRVQNEFAAKVQLRYQHERGIYYPPANKAFFLSRLADFVRSTVSYVDTGGLYNGRIGLILFFYQYAAYSDKDEYRDLADRMLNGILANLNRNIPAELKSGLCGLGLLIGYLIQHGFVEGKPDEVLSEMDEMIMAKTDFSLEDWSFETGLLGVMYYVAYRLSTTSKKQNLVFTDDYVNRLSRLAEKLQNHKEWICPDQDMLDSCKNGLQGKPYVIDWTVFLHKVITALPTSQSLGSWPLGLNCGASGYGVSMILNLDI